MSPKLSCTRLDVVLYRLYCIWLNVSNQKCSLLGIDAMVAMPLEGLATKHTSTGISRVLKKNQIKYVGSSTALSVTIDTHGDWGNVGGEKGISFFKPVCYSRCADKGRGFCPTVPIKEEGAVVGAAVVGRGVYPLLPVQKRQMGRPSGTGKPAQSTA
jgi:hypothetical protein